MKVSNLMRIGLYIAETYIFLLISRVMWRVNGVWEWVIVVWI